MTEMSTREVADRQIALDHAVSMANAALSTGGGTSMDARVVVNIATNFYNFLTNTTK